MTFFFENIYRDHLNEVQQLDVENVSCSGALRAFFQIAQKHLEQDLTNLNIQPDTPNEFMTEYTIIKSRLENVREIVEFLDRRINDVHEKQEQSAAE